MDSCKPVSQTLISSTSSTSIAELDNSVNEHFRCSSDKRNSIPELTPNSQQLIDSPNGFIGSLEIFIHQARDIQNICIYHKQDVYAKLYLTTNPESTISTKIINGGGRNPIFNESARLIVQTIDSSLKCEIWMLSRAKNYLGDQLLGFALVPLSEIIIGNGKLAQEFSLSSTDLFHSPSGFVQLSLSYTGSSPEVMVVAEPVASAIEEDGLKDSVADDSIIPPEYDKIEFPDLKIVNENKMMVSEYYGIPCLDSQNGDDSPDNDVGVKIVESFSNEKNHDCTELLSDNSPSTCVSSDLSSVLPSSTSEPIAEPSKDSEVADFTGVSSTCMLEKAYVKPLIEVNIELEQPVVQQEIVDMYMKSMKQFTESLANMKLPMDIENSSSVENGNGVSGKKLQAPKNGSGRVFYGSRAFF